MSQIVHVGVAVVVSPDRTTVLVCRRRLEDYWGGYWEFPGGKCEPGETPQQCIIRELREELAITVRPTAGLPEIQHHYADRDRLVHLNPYLCEWIDGQPTAVEVAEFRWVTPAGLSDLQFLPANGPLIEAVRIALSAPPPLAAPAGSGRLPREEGV